MPQELNPIEAAQQHNAAALNQTVELCAFRMLDPTMPQEVKRFAAERLKALVDFVLQSSQDD